VPQICPTRGLREGSLTYPLDLSVHSLKTELVGLVENAKYKKQGFSDGNYVASTFLFNLTKNIRLQSELRRKKLASTH